MVSFLPILTCFLVFVTIFSPSYSLKCHLCQQTPECAKKEGGPVSDCKTTDIINPTGCVTVKSPGGKYSRYCSNQTGFDSCKVPAFLQYHKCKTCTSDACNIHIDF